MQQTWVWSLGREDPWRRKWLPTPVFLPGEYMWYSFYWQNIKSNLLVLYSQSWTFFLYLGFKLPKQSTFVKLNELNLVPKHFADAGCCKPERAASIPNLHVRVRGRHANKTRTGFKTSRHTMHPWWEAMGSVFSTGITFYALSSSPQLSEHLRQSVTSERKNIWLTLCQQRMMSSCWLETDKAKPQPPKLLFIKRPVFPSFSAILDNFSLSLLFVFLIFPFSLVIS